MFDFTDANWTTTYRGVVTAWDCDHVGHLNIAHYVSRFDESHWPFFGEVGLTPVFLRDYGCGKGWGSAGRSRPTGRRI